MGVLISILLCAIMIGVMTFAYDKKIKRLEEEVRDIHLNNTRLISTGSNLLFDFKVLIEVLKDHFSEEEIDEMFIEKRSKLLKDEKGEYYDG